MIKTLQATVDAANKREQALTQERDNLKEEIEQPQKWKNWKQSFLKRL